MANTLPDSPSAGSSSTDFKQLDDEESHRLDLDQLVESLPRQSILDSINYIWYRNFWCPQKVFPGAHSFYHQFNALNSDVIVASLPKTGTTWLKALMFSIIRRAEFPPASPNHHPLTSSNPHSLVPFFEFNVYGQGGELLDLASLPAPRLFATHVPHDSLPESIHQSACRIVYISRNPLDSAVSAWHFTEQVWPETIRVDQQRSREKYFDYYYKGIQAFGPFWEHILGYWKASLARPDKVLFLKYEDLKEDTTGNIKRMAEFLGVPFSEEEEKEGVVKEIVKLCSLSNLKELEVNKTGKPAILYFENNTYFRKGEVGDWVNHMSPAMAKKLESVIEEKITPFGLKFGSK